MSIVLYCPHSLTPPLSHPLTTVATCYACPQKATEVLGWSATRSLEDMCKDLWKWQSNNPQGYAKASDGEGEDKVKDKVSSAASVAAPKMAVK